MADIVFIGPGRVGTALALCFQSVGHRVRAAYNRDTQSDNARRFTELTGVPVKRLSDSDQLVSDLAPLRQADAILLTVKDEAVTPMAQALTKLLPPAKGQIVAHTAGSLASDALDPLPSIGVHTLSLHPLQTVADPANGPALMDGITFTLEGDTQAAAQLSKWVRAFGGHPVTLSRELRPQYHAAAVLASNALIALASAATQVCGLENGLEALLPLMKGAITNLERLGLPAALTGPIERGDVSTVKKHLHALVKYDTVQRVYSALGLITADVALKKGSIWRKQWREIRHLLD